MPISCGRFLHIRLTQEGVPAAVEYAEPLGSETVLHLQVMDQKITLVTDQTGVFHRGQQVMIDLDVSKFHFFNAEGNRI